MSIFYFLGIWFLIGLSLWRSWQLLNRGVAHLRRLHQIPCSRCAFFTGDYRLKCTVHPCTALSEQAINCRDFEPNLLMC